MYEREMLPYYGGLVSFFRAPGIEFDQITEGLAVVAGVPIDNGIPYGRGRIRFGPRAIREASMRERRKMGTSEELNTSSTSLRDRPPVSRTSPRWPIWETSTYSLPIS